MVFSKSTSYGIRALAYLAHYPDRLCGAPEISTELQIPPVYLRKILGELRRHRLLASVKGIHGGYRLNGSPESITFWDVFCLLEPDRCNELCLMACAGCTPETECDVRKEWEIPGKEIMRFLQSRKIHEVAVPIRRQVRTVGTSGNLTGEDHEL